MCAPPEFIIAHTTIIEPGTPAAAEATDMIYMAIGAKGPRDEAVLQELMDAYDSEYPVNIGDHMEHSYLELGGWLGSQEYAMRLMALGNMWNMWQLLTPRTMMGKLINEEMVVALAGRGLITIVVPEHAPAG